MSETSNATAGRNDPCPCGSGKKFKRCCGFNTPVVQTIASVENAQGAIPSPIPGFDPSQLNPEWIQNVSTAFARLPKGQRQKLQAMISKAMAGKDVSRESAELEKHLPVELQTLLNLAPVPETPAADPGTPQAEEQKEEVSKSSKFWRKIFRR